MHTFQNIAQLLRQKIQFGNFWREEDQNVLFRTGPLINVVQIEIFVILINK